jgi:RNA polymerase sigma factor (sigma-70 family)
LSRDFDQTRWTLVEAAGAGDAEALAQLAERYRPPLLAFVRRRGPPGLAEDLTQEVFIRLLRSSILARADKGAGRFRSLLLGVARNVIARHHQRQATQKRGGGKVIRGLGELDPAAQEEQDDFDREWVRRLLQLAFQRLEQEHPNYFAALRLYLLEEKSAAEVAEVMGKTKANVKNYVHRGRTKLVGYLREEVWGYSGSEEERAEELAFLTRALPPER